MGRRRIAITVALCAGLVVGCGSAVGNPAPAESSSAGSSPTGSSFVGSSDGSLPAGSAPVSAEPEQATTPASDDEIMVWIPAGDHRVPGTLALPAAAPGDRVPAVLLLHGDLSSRDENGDMFARLAAALAAHGIASLRIDFAGSGDSEEPDLALDYPGMVLDATASLDYLRAEPRIDPREVAVLGLSRGGAIGATVTGTVPGVAAFVSWSGAVENGYDEDPDGHQLARENGYVPVDFGDHVFRLGLNWFDTIEQSHPLDDVAGYTGPILAVVGSDDDVVDPEVSTEFLRTVASTDTTLYVVEGADHGFTANEAYGDEAIRVTADWLVSRFG